MRLALREEEVIAPRGGYAPAPDAPAADSKMSLRDLSLSAADIGGYRRLRVCHLGKYYPPAPGGIEAHVQSLARAQAELGAHVRVICINHLNDVGRDVTWHRYGVTRTHEDRDGDIRVTRLGRSGCVARLDIVPNLLHVLRALPGRFDIVHVQTPNPTMVAALAALRLQLPVVVSHQSDVIRQRLLRYAYGPLENMVYGRAAMILATTPAYAEGSPVLQAHAGKVQVLPLGIDLRPFTDPNAAALEHARRLKEKLGDVIWLCVGRCVYYKGLENAVHALRRVPGRLAIIGHGPMELGLRELAAKLHVSDRIVWMGHASQDELIGAYHAATALWFPSTHKSEAYGLVQVEAMASGCPVINTEIADSGVTWVSRHNESGLTVPVGSSAALAEAGNLLLRDRDLRERLIHGARRRAVTEFNHHVMGVRSLNAYRAVIDAQRELGISRNSQRLIHRRIREIPPDSRHEHVRLAF